MSILTDYAKEIGVDFLTLEDLVESHRNQRQQLTHDPFVLKDGFEGELRKLINSYGKEKGSDTPDFALARFLTDCLDAYEQAVKWRGA